MPAVLVQVRVAEVGKMKVVVKPVGAVGAVGTVGVTLLEGADARPVPAALCAVTVNVYATPPVNPVMVRVLAVALTVLSVPSADPGVAGITVTMYFVIVAPFDGGALKVNVADPEPAVATTLVGASGMM